MMPVTAYTEPKIQPVTTWPQTVEERLKVLTERIEEISAVLGELAVIHGTFFEHGVQHKEETDIDDTDF